MVSEKLKKQFDEMPISYFFNCHKRGFIYEVADGNVNKWSFENEKEKDKF